MSDNFFKISKGITLAPQSQEPAGQNGDIYYNVTLGKFRLYENDVWRDLAGGGSGSGVKNLVDGGDAENQPSSIFQTYADTPATRPVDGLGGSPTVTTSITSTNPLDSDNSFLLIKPASNVQGQGWSVPFSVDPAYRSKLLNISFDYILNSGTLTAGSSTADGDLIVYIFDVTNNVLIEPSNIKLFSNSTTVSDKFNGTFQTSYNASSYRLIVHCASTSASALQLKVDNVTITDNLPAKALLNTKKSSITIQLSGAQSLAQTTFVKLNMNTVVSSLTSSDAVGWLDAPNFRIRPTRPGRYSVSGGMFLSNNNNRSFVNLRKNGAEIRNGHGGAASGDYGCNANIEVEVNGTTDYLELYAFTFSSTNPSLATGYLDTYLQVTHIGDSVVESDGYDQRDIVVTLQRITSSFTIVANSWNTISFNNYLDNTFGSTGTITIPSSGFYDISHNLMVTTASANIRVATRIVVVSSTGTSNYRLAELDIASGLTTGITGNAVLYLTAGTTVTLQGYGVGANVTMYSSATTEGGSRFTVRKIQSVSPIAGSEFVGCSYSSNSGQSIASGAVPIVPFEDKTYDSHGAYNTSTGVYTFPESGKYLVTVNLRYANGYSFSASGYINTSIFVDGSNNVATDTPAPVSATYNTGLSSHFSTIISALSGSTLDIRTQHSEASARPLIAANAFNNLTITKVG